MYDVDDASKSEIGLNFLLAFSIGAAKCPILGLMLQPRLF